MLQHSSRAQEETVVMYRRHVWKSFYFFYFYLFITKIFIYLFIYLNRWIERKKAFIEFMESLPRMIPFPHRSGYLNPGARYSVPMHVRVVAGLQRSCFMCTCTDGLLQVCLLSFTLSSIISHGWSTWSHHGRNTSMSVQRQKKSTFKK